MLFLLYGKNTLQKRAEKRLPLFRVQIVRLACAEGNDFDFPLFHIPLPKPVSKITFQQYTT